jgi:SAM-dependent methyltransferase
MRRRLFCTRTLALVAGLALSAGAAFAQHGDPIAPERIFRYERQPVTVPDFAATGWILDIGAGGEGIIGQLKGAQVVGIDLSARELKDAPPGPLKIVMDASDLKFIDGSFNTVSCFFTMMYIPANLHDKVFSEVARVMAPGGRFLLWDPILPAQPNPKQDIVVVPLTINLPKGTVQTGYGVHWPQVSQDVAYWTRVGERAGLKAVVTKVSGQTFYLEFVKPAAAPATPAGK